MLQPTFILFLVLLVAIISKIYETTELVGDVCNSKLAMHGRVAELHCLWATCMQGAEDNKAILFSLISALQTA